MRVLYLSRGGNPHDRRFLTALAEAEYEVSFLPMEVPAESERGMVPGSVELIEIDEELSSERLKEMIVRVQPDLVHAGPIHTGAYVAAQAGWHPLVSMSWGSDLLRDAIEGEGKAIAQQTLSGSDVLVCDSEAGREAAVGLGMHSDRIFVFPWGVDLGRFFPGTDHNLREQLGWQDHFVLLSTRAWEPLYGVDVLIDAFIRAARSESSLRLLLLGKGSQAQELINRIEKAGLVDRVHMPGQIEASHLPTYYRSSDLYISTSHSDGTSVSLLEAMACGLPVIVSDIPSNREWVKSEVNGWLFEDGNSNGLAARILEVSTTQRSEVGAAARGIAERRADWSVNFPRLLEAYDMALNSVKHAQ